MKQWKSALAGLKNRIGRFERPVVVITSALALTAVLINLEFNLLEANFFDFRMAYGPQARPDTDIVLVTIDDATIKTLDEFSPLPMDIHAWFLESVERAEPRAVGYLVDLSRVNDQNPDAFRGEWGARFLGAANRMNERGIHVLIGTNYNVNGEVLPPYPLSSLPHSLAMIHKDGSVFAEDKVTRRALTYLHEKPVFHVDLAQRLGLLAPGARPRGSFNVPEAGGQFFFFKYHGSTAGERETYPRVSFLDILKGNTPAESLRGKILLVGSMSKDDSGDYSFTPFSKRPYTNPKLVIHANILDSVIHNDGVVRAPNWVNWLITFAVVVFVFGWVLVSTPLKGVFATLGLAVLFASAAQLMFSLGGIWLRMSQPIVGIFLGYYLVVPYRLIREYKKRWDYQRRNALLMQVEELKTNFLSLVTHDLKTPVARIQGLAEVLMSKAGPRLVDRDVETIAHILNATDELNRFISSILELTKVESNRMQLNLESKDVNQLLEKCLEGFKAPARAKRIEIIPQLEPLFPIRLDASLTSKVLNNLVDNAIKYSAPGTQIVVESREIGPWVEIAVRDQGIGMDEKEREMLFTRFYRVKNTSMGNVAGTGLGLYLTKYFVEAHHGEVEVESEKGQGSTFKIRLPLEIGSVGLKMGELPGNKRERGTSNA